MLTVLRAIVVLGLCLGATLVGLCALAGWVPAFDVVSNGLPFLLAGALGLLVLALFARSKSLPVLSGLLVIATLAVLVPRLGGSAPAAADGAERALRIATFNIWGRSDHRLTEVAEFLSRTNADVVVLEEVRGRHADFVESLGSDYPHRAGDHGLVLLSKHPFLDDGRIDRKDEPFWMSLIIRWVRIDVQGKPVTVAGVHLARPFYPELQDADIARLTRFAAETTGPLILAGDFNMAPWTRKLSAFTNASGLGRFNTYRPTWPMRWKSLPLLPLLPIDNVFASKDFANLSTTAGPRLQSDHRPVIADIALIE